MGAGQSGKRGFGYLKRMILALVMALVFVPGCTGGPEEPLHTRSTPVPVKRTWSLTKEQRITASMPWYFSRTMIDAPVQIEGLIVDPNREPIVGHPVDAIYYPERCGETDLLGEKRRSGWGPGKSIGIRETCYEGNVVAKAMTNAQGRFSLTLPPINHPVKVYVDFHPDSMRAQDRVKYRKESKITLIQEPPVQLGDACSFGKCYLTNRIHQGAIELSVQKVFSDDWPRIQELIASYGSDSDKSKILRAWGLPSDTTSYQEAGYTLDTWTYSKQAVIFSFQNNVFKSRYDY